MTATAQSPPSTRPAILASRAAHISQRLKKEYGPVPRGKAHHPTDSLIHTILSQHTADRNSGAAFAALQRRYATWQEVAAAPTRELASTIRSAGLANVKAVRIQEALRTLEDRFDSMDLDFLKQLPLDEARRVLLSLPGVGAKTAACVLLFSCDLPALPVDTHVHRVSRRLGLIGPRVTAEAAHAELQALIPPEDVYDFHVNLIRHGRLVCRAREPRCGECVLQSVCEYYRCG
ncbi:MAG: endonuclease III [Chloroflexi bacterium]|nr:endonuclease III [Chloroflexota bacterium]